jgi:hypothetical protein
LAVLVLGLLVLSGCDDDLPEALGERALGVDTEIGDDVEEPSLDDQGETEPDGEDFSVLPDEFPVPAGTQIEQRSTEDVQGGTRVMLTVRYDGEYDRATAFYDVELEQAGWTVTGTEDAGLADRLGTRYEIEGFGTVGTVTVEQVPDPDDDGPQATLFIDLRPAG